MTKYGFSGIEMAAIKESLSVEFDVDKSEIPDEVVLVNWDPEPTPSEIEKAKEFATSLQGGCKMKLSKIKLSKIKLETGSIESDENYLIRKRTTSSEDIYHIFRENQVFVSSYKYWKDGDDYQLEEISGDKLINRLI